MSVSIHPLTSTLEWDQFRGSQFAPGSSKKLLEGLEQLLKELGTTNAVVEEEYLDQDFSREFAYFYATVFKRHTKLCKRIHFFSADAGAALDPKNPPQTAVQELNKLSENGQYNGFVVIRPIIHAPVAKAVLKAPPPTPGSSTELLIRAQYETHLLGATLRVQGVCLTQQDARVGVCAHASIWMALRHFHIEHRGPWVSVVDINEAATKIKDQIITRALPAGSKGLTLDNMLRALDEVGRKPLLYAASFQGGAHVWQPTLDPRAVIHRYLDSGIPVILCLDKVNHAVVATGVVRTTLPANHVASAKMSRAEFCSHFLVNDDQRGVHLRMSMVDTPNSFLPYSLENVYALIIPLPPKVFVPAESAEQTAWGDLNRYMQGRAQFFSNHQADLAPVTAVADQFEDAYKNNRVVARTYLTYGWRYQQRMIANRGPEELKARIFQQQFPRYVWVTEFGTVDSFNHLDDSQAEIFGHAVTDATSSNFWEGRSIFHAPGKGTQWRHNPKDQFGPFEIDSFVCADHPTYGIKIRGKD